MTPPPDRNELEKDDGTKCIALGRVWEELRRVRTAIEEYFVESSQELRDAATMTATELAENVLKHGSDPGSGLVTLSREAGAVVISTQNRVDSTAQADAVRAHIENIADKGAREVYVARMMEVMEEPDAHRSGLGLVRIAYEGAFQLSCEVLGDRLHIHARRQTDHALPN